MSEYIKIKLKQKKVVMYNISDLHVGSKGFHEEALVEILQRVLDEKAYLTFGGDATEAKLINSPHFNPDGLKSSLLTPHKQADYVVDLFKEVADAERILMWAKGNHDMYLAPNFDLTKHICEKLGIEDRQGGYQTWLNVNGVTMHFWHGRSPMPRGAKDPIQREANQKAWLKNRMEGLADSAQAQYMAHTHVTMVVEPQLRHGLVDSGKNVKLRSFTEKPTIIDGNVFVPPTARWFANTGTFRRSGMFGHTDYTEIAGYPPVPMGCVKTTINGNRIENVEKVLI